MAAGLVAEGVATVRVQFPGSGTSAESFQANTLENMIDDMYTALEYALEASEVAGRFDTARIGLLGYSMGGRLAMLVAAKDPTFKAVALWAPAATDVIIDPAVSRSATDAAVGARSVEEYVIRDADHGFGFFDGFNEASERVVGITVTWFSQVLR